MEKINTHTGTALPLRRSNVDTDQIIPAEYLKRITRTGFEDGLFAAWRNDPAFILNDPRYAGADILVSGPDFGIGSSREHAVWALLDYGFRAVIGSRFGDIFRTNAGKNGLVIAVVDEADVHRLWTVIEQHPDRAVTVDVAERQVRAEDLQIPFQIDDYTRWQLLEGLDDIDVTLRHEAQISSYEGKRALFSPVTTTP